MHTLVVRSHATSYGWWFYAHRRETYFFLLFFHFACSITVYTNATINYSNQITLIIKCVCVCVCNCGVLVSNLHFYFQQKQREFFIEKQRNIKYTQNAHFWYEKETICMQNIAYNFSFKKSNKNNNKCNVAAQLVIISWQSANSSKTHEIESVCISLRCKPRGPKGKHCKTLWLLLVKLGYTPPSEWAMSKLMMLPIN